MSDWKVFRVEFGNRRWDRSSAFGPGLWSKEVVLARDAEEAIRKARREQARDGSKVRLYVRSVALIEERVTP